MTSLYEISEDITKIAAAMEAAETVEEQDEVAKQRDSLQMDFNTKIENVLKVMRDADTDAIKIKAEAVRLAQLAESKTKLAERLKMYVSTILQIQGIEKLDLDLFKLSFRASDTLEIVDEALIPDVFKEKVVTESIKIDKNKIKAFIKTGTADTIISVP